MAQLSTVDRLHLNLDELTDNATPSDITLMMGWKVSGALILISLASFAFVLVDYFMFKRPVILKYNLYVAGFIDGVIAIFLIATAWLFAKE